MKDILLNEQQVLIEKYLNNQMSTEERSQFYRQIAESEAFAKQFLIFKNLKLANDKLKLEKENDAIIAGTDYSIVNNAPPTPTSVNSSTSFARRSEFYIQFRNSLNHQESAKEETQAQSKMRIVKQYSRSMLAAAAIFIILIAGTFYLMLFNNSLKNIHTANLPDNKELVDKNTLFENTNEKVGGIETTANTPSSEIQAVENNSTKELSLVEILTAYASEVVKNDETTLLAYCKTNKYELSDNFSENNFLTGVATSTVRSSELQVNIANFVVMTNPAVFTLNENELPSTLVIKNNKNEQVWSLNSAITKQVECNKQLAAGTYYLVLTFGTDANTKQIIRQFFITK